MTIKRKIKPRDLLFISQYENKILKDIIFKNELERWVPDCVYPHTEIEHLSRYRWAAKYVRGKTVVDLACGCGKGSYILATQGKAKKITACDNDKNTLKYASLKYNHSKIKYKFADAQNPSLKGGSTDIVISFETIEHLNKPDKFLKEVSRVLRPGGVFIVSTPISLRHFARKPANKYHTQEWSHERFLKLIRNYFVINDAFEQKGNLIRRIREGRTTLDYQIIVAVRV